MRQRQQRLGSLRQQRRGLFQRRQRGGGIAQGTEHLAQVAQRHRIPRPPRQRRPQRDHRLGGPAGLGQGGAAIGQEDRLLRRHGQGAVGMAQRAGGVAALAGQHAEQIMRVGLVRAALQHLAVEPLGRRQVAGGMARGALLQQRGGILGGHAAVFAAGRRGRNAAGAVQ